MNQNWKDYVEAGIWTIWFICGFSFVAALLIAFIIFVGPAVALLILVGGSMVFFVYRAALKGVRTEGRDPDQVTDSQAA